MNFNPYSVFEMPMGVDFETLRATYRRLARENHPDVAPDKPGATERMAQINRAWAILGDETKRANFDAQWRLHIAEQTRREQVARHAAHQTRTADVRRTPQSSTARATNNAAPNRETPRRESQNRQSQPRETPRPESTRQDSTRPRAAQNPASGKTVPRAASKVAKNQAKSEQTSAARGPIGAESRGASSRRGASQNAAKTAAARGSAATTRSRNSSQTHSGDSTSPRALRLMRKITIASRVYHRDGNARDAIETCRAVLLADGRNVAARELLAEIYAAQHRYELALMMLEQAIQIAPDDQYLRFKRGRIEALRFPNSDPRAKPRRSLWGRLRALISGKRA